MKKLNYYQVHKNKKPINRKVKTRSNALQVKLGLIALIGASQLAIIKSQVSGNKNGQHIKKVESIKVITETANLISKEIKEQKKQMYLNRIKK